MTGLHYSLNMRKRFKMTYSQSLSIETKSIETTCSHLSRNNTFD